MIVRKKRIEHEVGDADLSTLISGTSVKKPKFSIITPSYNQSQFIERTIRSVLSQDYPGVEYIVMDGKSTDSTIGILKKYKGRLKWKSESDSGQSDAINKALRQATGEIVAFINSDDVYELNALSIVAKYFDDYPDTKWVYGRCKIIDKNDQEIRKPITFYKNLVSQKYSYTKLLIENYISQPATFWKRELHEEFGYFDENNHWCMDYEFWLRIGQKYPAGVVKQYLASFRHHSDSKSVIHNKGQFEQELMVAKNYSKDRKLILLLHRINFYKITWTYKLINLFKTG